MSVSGYDDAAQPLFGNYCVLLMREDETIIIRVFQSKHPHGERFKKSRKQSRLMPLGGVTT